jgi:hypothetical protein
VLLSALGCVCSPVIFYPIAILIKLIIWSIQSCCCKSKELKSEMSKEDPVVVVNPVVLGQPGHEPIRIHPEQEDPQV